MYVCCLPFNVCCLVKENGLLLFKSSYCYWGQGLNFFLEFVASLMGGILFFPLKKAYYHLQFQTIFRSGRIPFAGGPVVLVEFGHLQLFVLT